LVKKILEILGGFIMKIDLYSYEKLLGRLDQIVDLLKQLVKENKHMSLQMDELIQAVTAENTVIDSAITLIEGFNASLASIQEHLAAVLVELELANANTVELAAVNDEALALHDEVEAKTAVLAAAVNFVPPVV
jgi:hypothetical protein